LSEKILLSIFAKMPTSDNQNTGFIPTVGQTQDPVTTNDPNQTSTFDFSLDLPDSFPSASNTVTEETSAPEQQIFPSAEEPVSENVPTVEEMSTPVDTGMDFLHEEPVAQGEDSSLEESAEVALGPSQEDIVSVEEMPLPSSDFSVGQEDTMPSYSSEPTQMVSDVVEETSVQATSQETVPASLQMPSELPTSFVQKEEENQTLTSVSSGEEEVNIPSSFAQPQESSQTSVSFVSQIPAPEPVMQDPFDAMRTSLNQNLTPESVVQESTPVSQSLENPVAQTISSASEKPMGMLSLDEMIAQPVATPAPTMNLDAMMGASAPGVANPLSNPVAYPSITQPQPAKNKMSALVAVFGVFALIVAVGFMAFLKYPNEIQQMFGLGGGAIPAMQMAQLTGEQEHGAAELTGEVMTGSTVDNATDASEAEESVDLGEVTIDEKQAETSDDVQEVVLGDTSSDAEESTTETEIKSDESQNSTAISGNTSSEPVDALGAVEGIVGEVSANETLTQQVENFKLKAQQIADTGKAQGNRMMLKYGIYVVNQVKKVQDDLANGQKMSISEWNTLKSELELSLAKAQNNGN
jgi:hypothetical protein